MTTLEWQHMSTGESCVILFNDRYDRLNFFSQSDMLCKTTFPNESDENSSEIDTLDNHSP